MIANNVWQVELGILSDPVCGGYGYKMSRLGQAIHNDPYWVVPTWGARQTHDEVHADVFPLPQGNAQWLQISSWPQMIGLDPSTRVTLWHISYDLPLHSHPPEIILQVLIHFVSSMVDRVSRAMSTIHDLVMKLKVLWDHKAILEPRDSLRVSSETLCFTRLHPSSDVLYSNIRLLRGDDIIFDGWNNGYIV
jgi:hypothetical protein